MPNLAFIPTALAGAIVMDIYHTRRYKKLAQAATNYVNELEGICELRDQQVQFLISIIVASEVPLDEFDTIALNALDLIKDKE